MKTNSTAISGITFSAHTVIFESHGCTCLSIISSKEKSVARKDESVVESKRECKYTLVLFFKTKIKTKGFFF